MIKFIFVSLLCLQMALVWATIVEIDSMDQVPSLVEGASLLLFDVDDTLISYPGHLGSEPWFCEARQQLKEDEFQRIAGQLAELLTVVAVESRGPAVVSELQSSGLLLMRITARESVHPAVPNWLGKTRAQLQDAGYDLTISAPCLVGFDYQTMLIAGGVLFTGWGRKGEGIVQLVQQLDLGGKIVVVDDRLSDLEDVAAALDKLGLPFVGIWYRAIEPRRARYNSAAAQKELQILMADAVVPAVDPQCAQSP